ncbi:uncharacterized protein [Littorina saxatilis]|uniref:Uncharacterized protein n=1 Tax=Littorina saxatilis TaxID=31220 RepID=A0AAN9GM17_9CAEN
MQHGLLVTVLFLPVLVLIFVPRIGGQQDGCSCGFESSCINSTCTCSSGFSLHTNGKDCKNDTCAASDCLKCSEPSVCIRCVNFILADDGRCVDRCTGNAEVRTEGRFQGTVCMPQKESSDTKLIIGIVAGVGAGLVLCLVVILIVCIYIRKTRKKVTLQNQHYKAAHMEMGNIKQYPVYDNQGYDNEMNGDLKTGVIDPVVYAHHLEQLRPHTETLMMLLSQIRPKLRAMDPADPRVSTYKGVIHQLCRVLVLLHKKDAGSSIPSDALGIIEWAHQMLEDHRQQHELHHDAVSPDVLGDLGHGRISYIDVDMETERLRAPLPTNTVYAEPGGSVSQSLRSASAVSPYSSVPVPMPPGSSTFPRTFATIHRAPSVPGTANNNNGRGVYSQDTINRHTSKSSKPKNKSIGYFANGRYYDPNPMPEPEVYAPASSYSDRSTAHLSTFIPDRPRSRSLSSSEASSEGDGYGEEGSDGDIDMFPFDPKDATDPVEV